MAILVKVNRWCKFYRKLKLDQSSKKMLPHME